MRTRQTQIPLPIYDGRKKVPLPLRKPLAPESVTASSASPLTPSGKTSSASTTGGSKDRDSTPASSSGAESQPTMKKKKASVKKKRVFLRELFFILL